MKQPEQMEAQHKMGEENLLAQIDLEVSPRLDGIVLCELTRIGGNGVAYVSFPGTRGDKAAQTTVNLAPDAVGRQVACMFLQGSAERPIIMGLIQNPLAGNDLKASVDGKQVTISADSEIRLECGKASILLRADGKIVLRGTNLISRSSGANKIKGASVGIN